MSVMLSVVSHNILTNGHLCFLRHQLIIILSVLTFGIYTLFFQDKPIWQMDNSKDYSSYTLPHRLGTKYSSPVMAPLLADSIVSTGKSRPTSVEPEYLLSDLTISPKSKVCFLKEEKMGLLLFRNLLIGRVRPSY
jgi:hypothetical protein